MASRAVQAYATPFQRHLSYYDRDQDGFIYFSESLRASLSLGLDFPVAVLGAVGLQCWYGNTGPFFLGPFRGIEIAKVQGARNMLERIDTGAIHDHGLDRKALLTSSGAVSLLDKLHVRGLHALAANGNGILSKDDIQQYQKGTMLYELEKRRKDRSDVLPLSRGGPIIVSGHSWFVDKLFGVKVYQQGIENRDKKH